MATNAQILSAVINKWVQPLLGAFLNANIQSIPIIQGLQNKVRSTGWVSPNWSLIAELSPIMESITGNIVAPMINKYISQIDDASLPKIAHEIVDNALKNGELALFEGKVIFERSDIEHLKKLLDLNLPYNPSEELIIKTEQI